jgi:hypothetical protein
MLRYSLKNQRLLDLKVEFSHLMADYALKNLTEVLFLNYQLLALKLECP